MLLAASCAVLHGCVVGALVGGMADSYMDSAKVMRPSEYDGLQNTNFAVLVSTDRSIQAEFPALINRITNRITAELSIPERTQVMGVVPGPAVLEFQYTNPDWAAWTYKEIATEFQVERLIVVDIYDFRLYEPGNVYLWDGRAAARIGVIEADGPAPDDFSYTKEIQVTFPDGSGYGPSEIPIGAMQANLSKRLVDRITWLFYEHEEDYRPKY